MASAHDIASLMVAAMAPPSGNGDIGFHQGVIQSWDELSGVNTVTVNGATVSNVKTFQTGIGVPYFAGDVVGLFRFQSTYFILGKITAPGGTQANQIKSADVPTYETTTSTSYADLATTGPLVTATIGSSRRCLVAISAIVTCSGNPAAQFIGGNVGVELSGATSIAPNASNGIIASMQLYSPSATVGAGVFATASKIGLWDSSDGLNQGVHTFKLKYKSNLSSPACGFQDRSITVIPF